jgi:hypothetical protein
MTVQRAVWSDRSITIKNASMGIYRLTDRPPTFVNPTMSDGKRTAMANGKKTPCSLPQSVPQLVHLPLGYLPLVSDDIDDLFMGDGSELCFMRVEETFSDSHGLVCWRYFRHEWIGGCSAPKSYLDNELETKDEDTVERE